MAYTCTRGAELTEEWRKLRTQNNFFNIQEILLRRARESGHVACMGKIMGNANKTSVGKLKGKRPLTRHRHKWCHQNGF
jgi:hypothetical protein